ncbi:P-loop NTPase fold protein [Chryseobacterium cucumeris]|uniref:KAP family P-loop NTPase fold protein n=1 Tax=Chryseobacterium cucumeris TaxID=1813611 RepID=UPI00192DF2B8|nr:P-loop NTPase fold protein [Chryseobacterium cucumeris]QRA41912.1 hypothetical protein JNG87_14930 [Chryseobacterium cucumeris]
MKINQLLNNIFSFLIGLGILIILTPFIEGFLDKSIDSFKFDKINESVLLDVILLLALCLYTSICVSKWKEHVPNNITTYFFLSIIIFYTYERYFNEHYDFLNFKIHNSLFYFDIIFPIVILYLGNYLKFFAEEFFSIKKNILYEDSPIKDEKDNELGPGFSKTVKKIETIVNENNFVTSYTIGINSEWGGGKSTVLAMLKKRFEDNQNVAIIDFNPWMGFDEKVFVKDFFNSLSEALTENNISSDISHYSEELINVTDNSLLKSIKAIFFREKSLENHFNNINEKIKLLNKKLIIVVDDIDRLDKEEVFQLLKLIRNTANFSNTFFIVAYDREYIISSISGVNEYLAVNYLDKIINTELTLPYYDRNILKEIFKNKLIEKIGEEYRIRVTYALDMGMGYSQTFDNNENILNDFTIWISNIRQIKKMINSIYINFNGFFNEINFTDLIYLELLKLHHPYLYKSIYNKKDIIFRETKGKLYLEKINKDPEEGMDNTVFGRILKDYCNGRKIGDNDKESIYSIFTNLFSIYKNNMMINLDRGNDLDEKLSISYSSKFERYFAQYIFRGNISENDFNVLLNIGENERRKMVIDLIDNGKEKDLKFRFLTDFSYKNKQEFENTIKTILQLVNTNSRINPEYKIGYEERKFKYKIQEYSGNEKFVNLYESKEELKQFINGVFLEAEYPYLFESSVLRDINLNLYKGSTIFSLNNKEINILLKSYFMTYLYFTEYFDSNFFHLLINCKKIMYSGNRSKYNRKIRLDNDIKDIIIEKLEDDNNSLFYMKSLIDYEYDNIVGIRKESIIEIFDSMENFEKLILMKIDENALDAKKEFKYFYYNVRAYNWKAINYDFKFFDFSEGYVL